MGKYVALPGNPSGSESPRIALEQDDGSYVTVLSRSVHDNRFPVETLPLLQNFASLLNCNPPLNTMASGKQQVFYQCLSSGVSLHFRKPDGGISEVGMMLTVPGHDHARALGMAALKRIDPTFMKLLCDAIDMGTPATGMTAEYKAPKPQLQA